MLVREEKKDFQPRKKVNIDISKRRSSLVLNFIWEKKNAYAKS